MAEVVIGGYPFFSYATTEQAETYSAGAIGADAWRAEMDSNVKNRALVTATRVIDRQRWRGTADTEDHAFPRDGQPIPQAVVDATIELAFLILSGEDVANTSSGQTQARRIKAGSVEVENFKSFAAVTRFPKTIMELLAPWLLGSGTIHTVSGAVATGTDVQSAFSTRYPVSGGR